MASGWRMFGNESNWVQRRVQLLIVNFGVLGALGALGVQGQEPQRKFIQSYDIHCSELSDTQRSDSHDQVSASPCPNHKQPKDALNFTE